MKIIIEAILYFFVELLFGKLIIGLLRIVEHVGLKLLGVITLSKLSIIELRSHYRNSSIPYFLGFGVVIFLLLLIFKVLN